MLFRSGDDAYAVSRRGGGADTLRDTASSSPDTNGEEDDSDEVPIVHADAEPLVHQKQQRRSFVFADSDDSFST